MTWNTSSSRVLGLKVSTIMPSLCNTGDRASIFGARYTLYHLSYTPSLKIHCKILYVHVYNMEQVYWFTIVYKRKFQWLVFVNMRQIKSHLRGGGNSFHQTGIFSVANWGTRAQPIVDGSIPGQMGWGCIRKLAEQPRETNKQRSSAVYGSSFCLELLSCFLLTMDYSL